ncbi:MAG: hypothetical protein HQL35_01820 [Alphaproteobacteria bacterium]|nr:hypothetical protein [Alphaproteobacteria bacterium]
MSDAAEVHEKLKLSDRATLSLLATLENGDQVTQRGLAASIGVALGLTNSLLKRAVRKGLVKAQQAPAKRYAYYVTPKGFREKSRLVADYLSSSLAFFRQAREEYETVYAAATERNFRRIALYGAGELAEIAMLPAQDGQVEIACVIHPGSNQPTFMGAPVVGTVADALEQNIDAVVIACVDAPQDAFDTLIKHIAPERVFAVPLLHVHLNSRGGDEA